MDIKSGEVWDVTHSRKGSFTARFIDDVTDADEFCEIEIAQGRAKFISTGNEISGEADTGKVIGSRVSFLTLNKRREDLEST